MSDHELRVLSFSPLSTEDDTLISEYLKPRSKRSTELTAAIMASRDVQSCPDIGREAIEVAVGQIIAKHAAGEAMFGQSGHDADGNFTSTRNLDSSARKAQRLLSRVLLAINWADSGPGFAWPEQYRVTRLVKEARWIVTASVDTDELYGCQHFALGHFKCEMHSVARKGMQIIANHWRLVRENCETPPWQGILDPGLIGSDVAARARTKIWRGYSE